MLIALIGPQNSGKTTLLAKCKSVFGDKFEYVDEIARTVQRKGFKINEDGEDVGQLLIINTHLDNSLKKNAILDRGIIDALVYAYYSYKREKISKWVYDYCVNMVNLIVGKYDLVFYLDPNIPLKADGVRNINPEFRNEIISYFESFFDGNKKNKNLIRLTGSVEERFATMQKAIEALGK